MTTTFYHNITELQLIILIIYIISLVVQLYYYLGIYIKPGIYKSKATNKKIKPVSIIICAKNEAENLSKNLPFVLDQDFPDFEVIVVDDASTDSTNDVLANFKQTNPHLKITSIEPNEKFPHGKKLALTIGIKAAKNEWLLLTDADCKPASNKWLAFMHNNFSDNTSIVLGYGGYAKKTGLLNNIIRFDTFFIAMQYLGFAIKGFPYMGVGRNLAYRKSLFFANKGFASHLNVPSGDDDLFIKETATKTNTTIEISHYSHTFSEACTSFKAWFYQKKRHLTTGKFYKSKIKCLLITENLSRLLFYGSFIVLLLCNTEIFIISAIFIFRMLIQLIVYKLITKKLNERSLIIPSIIYDIILPFINFSFIFTNMVIPKKKTWK